MKYWADRDNRRKLFLELAAKKGLNPSVASDMLSITMTDIMKEQVN